MLVLLAGLPGIALAAAPRPISVAVGADGELLELRAGMAMDLLPEASPIPGWNPVMTLDIVRAQGEVERIVVPGTEGIDSESAGQLVYDAGQVFVLWARDNLSGESFLRIEAFDGATWGERIDVSRESASLLGAPRLAVTRDAYLTLDGEAARTVLHVLWWQENEDRSGTRALYAPLVLLDGEYVGDHPVVDLAELDSAGPSPTIAAPVSLLHAADFHRGDNEAAVVLAAPNARTERLILARARALPAALEQVADEIRSHIVLIGLRLKSGGRLTNNDVGALADAIRSHIVLIGRNRMHSGVAEFIAGQVVANIIATPAPRNEAALRQLAETSADTATAAGRSLIGNTLRTEELSCLVASLPATKGSPWGHEIELCLFGAPELPATSATAKQHAVVISDDASETYLLWREDDAAVSYRRYHEGVWSPPQTVAGGAAVSMSQAISLFRARVGQL